MPNSHPTPILNASLPAQFRQIRLQLAREAGHPDGDAAVAYVLIAPLDAEDRIDASLWRAHREACRVARLRPDSEPRPGQLVHRSGGGWAFHYPDASNTPDEAGFHFADERFVAGEYVSINETGKMHTYRIVSVSHL
jgi:hypothetical protein